MRQRITMKKAQIKSNRPNIPKLKRKFLMIHLQNSIKDGKSLEVDKILSLLKDNKPENGEVLVIIIKLIN